MSMNAGTEHTMTCPYLLRTDKFARIVWLPAACQDSRVEKTSGPSDSPVEIDGHRNHTFMCFAVCLLSMVRTEHSQHVEHADLSLREQY